VHLKPELPRQISLDLGHPWIYSNEIANITDLTVHEAGTVVDVADANGDGFGVGVLNRQASIVVRRMGGLEAGADVTQELLRRRLREALAVRSRAFPTGDHYRAVNGEQDGLPGIFVDRFGSAAVITFESVGSSRLELLVQEELTRWMGKLSTLAVHRMVSKKEKWAQEGAEFTTDIVKGEESRISVSEQPCIFEIDAHHGVAGNWNFAVEGLRRDLIDCLPVAGSTVLDAWTHVGQWGTRCAKRGAAEVVLLEESLGFAKLCRDNVVRNEVESQCTVLHRGSVLEELKSMATSGIRFNCVSLNVRVKYERYFKQREGQFGRWFKPSLKGYATAVMLGAQVTSRGGYLAIVFYLPIRDEHWALSLVKDGLEQASRTGSVVSHTIGVSEHSALASSAMDDAWTPILVCVRLH